MKKLLLSLMAFIIIVSATFLLSNSDQPTATVVWEFTEDESFTIGVLPYRSDEEIQRDLGPLIEYLQHHLKTSVKLVIAPDYPTLGRLFELKKIQLGWFSHVLLEQNPDRDSLTVICRPQSAGKTEHKGGILVKEDSPLQTLDDLKGRRFAYVSRYSGSGFVFPAKMFRRLGIDPVASFSEIIFTGNHSASVEALISGSVDAAAIFCDATTEEIVLPAGLRALAFTEKIPSDPLVVRKDLDAVTRSKLTDLLVNISNFDKGPETIEHLKNRRGFEAFIAE